MRFGICYNIEYLEDVHETPSHYYEGILEQVELLEHLGYDTVWFSEHEAAEFMVKAWTGAEGPMTYRGKHFDLDGYTYFPKPVQRPYPPIYASAGTTLDSFRWAGAMGFNLGTALFLPDLNKVAEDIQVYRNAIKEQGHDASIREVMAITQMYCAMDPEVAIAEGKKYAEN
jgi:alkanesulfonate monooxygenase SsuD/methylene tetrahydromethanopterin reductase-like flavin-dependent oxidoreductase (luciferase family)